MNFGIHRKSNFNRLQNILQNLQSKFIQLFFLIKNLRYKIYFSFTCKIFCIFSSQNLLWSINLPILLKNNSKHKFSKILRVEWTFCKNFTIQMFAVTSVIARWIYWVIRSWIGFNLKFSKNSKVWSQSKRNS